MSISEIAAALIGLRETTYKDHQRFTAALTEVQEALHGLQGTVEQSVDRRLAQSAQALRDVERRLESEYERRIDATMMTLIDVVERLTTLAGTGASSNDVAELQERLQSCVHPRDKLLRLLEEHGIRPFSAEGEPYDPHRHEVVQRERVPDCIREYVLQELRAGYVRDGTDHTLVRAKVIVAAPPVMEGSSDG
jgi:molecular chaperone GrpE